MADVYSERPNLYIGFHGCEKNRGMKLIQSPNFVPPSTHDYEWLGHGFYVWENNIDRALDWGRGHHPSFNEPFVIGVVYTLGNCLALTDKRFIDLCPPLPFDNADAAGKGRWILICTDKPIFLL